MDVDRLRLLRELRDRGSVAAVAAAIGTTPSAVSQQLAALQRGYDARLTRKLGRRLVLTDAGEALATASVEVDAALARARDAVETAARDDRRVVRVSAFHSAGLLLFAPLLERLRGQVRIELSDADVAREEFARLTADQDLVIAHRLAHDPDWPTGRLRVVPLYREPIEVLLREDHPLASLTTLPAAALAEHPWVSVHPQFPLEGVLGQWGAAAGRPLRIEHRVNDFALAAAIVGATDCLAAMPSRAAAPLLREGLALRAVDGATTVRHVDVLARDDALAHGQVRRALDTLRVLGGAPAVKEEGPGRALPGPDRRTFVLR